MMTGGIYYYLYEKGISIGKDISVVGFDNESISAFFRPQLTTTELPLKEIGKTSALLLLDELEGSKGEKRRSGTPYVDKIMCKMIVRQSVSKIQ